MVVNPSGYMFSDPRHSVESKHERKLQSSAKRRPEYTNEANVVGRYNKDQQMRREEADVRPLKHSANDFDEPTRQPKQSREQMVPAIQRKPLAFAQQKRKLARPQLDVSVWVNKAVVFDYLFCSNSNCLRSCLSSIQKLKALDPDAKFEFAKRKLQESYQQHENGLSNSLKRFQYFH